MGSGDSVVDIAGTASGTTFALSGGLGDDTFHVAALPSSSLIIDGEAHSDTVNIVGTGIDDHFEIQGPRIGTEDGAIILHNIESSSLDAEAGADEIRIQGRAGTDEVFNLIADGTPDSGRLVLLNQLTLDFTNVEMTDVAGNSSDHDRAEIYGTKGLQNNKLPNLMMTQFAFGRCYLHAGSTDH